MGHQEAWTRAAELAMKTDPAMKRQLQTLGALVMTGCGSGCVGGRSECRRKWRRQRGLCAQSQGGKPTEIRKLWHEFRGALLGILEQGI